MINENKQMRIFRIKLLFVITLMLIMIITLTHAAFFVTKKQTNDNVILSGCFSTSFEDTKSISLSGGNALPLSDIEGSKLEPYHFKITNTCSLELVYYVIVNTKSNSFSNDYIKYSYNSNNASILSLAPENTFFEQNPEYSKSYIIDLGTLKNGESNEYDIRFWLNEETTYEQVKNKAWEAEVKVVSVVYNEKNIGISNMKLTNSTNASDEHEYTKDSTTIITTLDNNQSEVIYDVIITNSTNNDFTVKEIIEELNSNSNIKYDLIDLDIDTTIKAKSNYKFKIKLSNKTSSKQKTNLKLKYKFEQNDINYYVAFNPNAPENTEIIGTMDNQEFTNKDAQNLNENKFEDHEYVYVFDSWNTSKDGSGMSYENEQEVSGLAKNNGEIVNLYAQWRIAVKSTVQGNGEYLLGMMKNLSSGSTVSNPYSTVDTKTINFERASKEKYETIKDSLDSNNKILTDNSDDDIYMWFETDTIYFYTEADFVKLNGSAGKMFAKMSNLTDIGGLQYFDTTNVNDMNRMFQDSTSITDLSPIANWNVENVTDMTFMFGANPPNKMSITDLSPLSNWNVSNVTSLNQTFKYCKSVKTLDGLENWDVGKVTNFNQTFNNCNLVDALAIKDWNVLKGTTFQYMLKDNTSLISSKKPIFTVRPGSWDSNGTYNPS